jgi:hypothetical protein
VPARGLRKERVDSIFIDSMMTKADLLFRDAFIVQPTFRCDESCPASGRGSRLNRLNQL